MKKKTFAIRKHLIFLIFFGYLGLLSAQINSGDIVEEERVITGFTTIDVDDGIDVHLAPGAHTKVSVLADDHLLPKIKTEVSGRELQISMLGSYNKPQKLEVHIEMPVLEGVTARGGSDIFTVGSFQLNDFYIRLSQGSDLCLNMEAQKVSCKLSDGSDAHLRGKVRQLTADASGSSTLKAKELEVQKCKLQTISGSDAYIWVTGELEMEAKESSFIYYLGTPDILHQKASHDSDIRVLLGEGKNK